jgi:plastocyanin
VPPVVARGGGVLALVLGAVVVAVVAGAAGCGDDSGAPLKADLAVPRELDMAVLPDQSITTAGVVMVGLGGGNTFGPATVTIQAGQGVTWVWVSGFHSVVSDSSPKVWADSPGQASGQFVVKTFPTAGTFPYHCGVHGAMMSGTVVVQ